MTYLSRMVAGRKAFSQPLSWDMPAWMGSLSADRERIDNDFESYVADVYRKSGPVFSCVLVRQLVFSEARFLWRQAGSNGAWGDLFGTAELDLLERPWPGGTTGELLSRMEQDASLAGNSFWTTVDNAGNAGHAATGPGRRVARMVPSRVEIVIDSASGDPMALDARPVAYWYRTSQVATGGVLLTPDEVCHYSPVPDPAARFRGMSWVTPVLEEILGDQEASRHKRAFFRRGAQLQHAITFAKDTNPALVAEFRKKFSAEYGGSQNAYKTLVLTGGADVRPLSVDLKQLDFKAVQGGGETRIASAAGVPPILAGFSEGLESATYSNYGMARRRFADGTVRPLWRIAAASLQRMLTVPAIGTNQPPVSLWFDDRDISFLREDQKDASEIQAQEAQTIRTLVDAGYTPESVVAALRQKDWRQLTHSGAYSVQLQPPGTTPAAVTQGSPA